MVLVFLHSICRFFIIVVLNVTAVSSRSPPSFSFNFSDPSSYDRNDLHFESSATVNKDQLVDLTCNSQQLAGNSNCFGRMSYNHSVPFYDSRDGHVASFSTRFTFIIQKKSTSNRGDGMTFFLASYPSKLPAKSSGGNLGLTDSANITAYEEDRFVAVEFDTYRNELWDDPPSDHIGIDVNSIKSVNTTSLPTNSLNGAMTATITFDGRTRMLEASLHLDSNSSIAPAQVRTQLPEPLSDVLPPEVAVGFSAATGDSAELHRILSWSFNSTLAHKDRDAHRVTLIMGVVVAVCFLVAAWSIVLWYRWKSTLDSFRKGTRLKRFHYHDLAAATGNFSPEKKIGQGKFGAVYEGKIGDQLLAVKQLDGSIRVEHKTLDFLAELKAIGGTGHRNLARLEGWCCSINTYWGLLNFMCFGSWWRNNIELFVVYELVPNGDLKNHLQRNSDAVLPWIKRYKIVKDIGSALCYLHNECDPCILHRDIKPSNIFLDNHFNAKLGDFGLSRVMEANATSRMTYAVGTIGYMDPLCMKYGKVKFGRSSDIYSFGLVLLEIAHGVNNPDLVRQMHASEPADTFMVESLADKSLKGEFDRTQMERVIVLGLRCSDPDELQRPSMIGALNFLEQGGELRPAATTYGDVDECHGSPISHEQALMPYGSTLSC